MDHDDQHPANMLCPCSSSLKVNSCLKKGTACWLGVDLHKASWKQLRQAHAILQHNHDRLFSSHMQVDFFCHADSQDWGIS